MMWINGEVFNEICQSLAIIIVAVFAWKTERGLRRLEMEGVYKNEVQYPPLTGFKPGEDAKE